MTGVDWRSADRWLTGESYVGSFIPDYLNMLCRKIGTRWGGSSGERRAASYLRGELDSCGLENPAVERFQIESWESAASNIEVPGRPQWRAEARPALFSPPVDVSGPVVDAGYGMPHELDVLRRRLRGAIALVNAGLEPFSDPVAFASRLEALAGAGARAAVTPSASGGRRTHHISGSDWRDGKPSGGALPLVQTTKEDGAELARLAVEGAMVRLVSQSRRFTATSGNVVAELPGEHWPGEHILLGAHYDTTPDSPGANDNGSGTSVVLETARLLSGLRSELGVGPGRTIRFVFFGSEEQTLQGSFAYVARHHGKEAIPRLMINLDELSTGNMKGVALVFPELRALVQRSLDELGHGLKCHVMAQLDASGDMFPFACAGIPSAMLWRWRFVGRHPDAGFGHSSADTLDKVRVNELKEYAALLARLLLRLSHVPPGQWPANRLSTKEIRLRLQSERGTVLRTM
ncbi:MAG: M28 family peptidase [Chloroflexi bacterium]|nr:M28 family peptidase [Chloroflexota bacterium]